MKKEIIYVAANIAEANMLVHYLGKNGIEAEAVEKEDDEKLGMQRPIGLIPLKVDEELSKTALEIIRKWEFETEKELASKKPKKKPFFSLLLISFLFGAVGAIIYYESKYKFHEPTIEDNINNDGMYFVDGLLDRWEIDLNDDGKIDQITYYDEVGQAVKTKNDYNFNGTFDTFSIYNKEKLVAIEIDSNENGTIDFKHFHKKNHWYKTEYYNPKNGKVFKLEIGDGLNINEGRVDLDKDGKFDVIYKYDHLLEVTEKIKIKK